MTCGQFTFTPSPTRTNSNSDCRVRRFPTNHIVWNDLCVVPPEQNRIIHKWLKETENKFDNIKIDKYVIMPNHIHIIVVITERHAGRSLHDVMQWFETMATNEYIRDVKKGMFKPFNKRLFQQSFHDHIIRCEKDYQKIWEYIDTNPLKWELDRFYNDERS